MPPSRTKASKADTVVQDACYCDWPGCGRSVSRPHDLLRHKLIHFEKRPPYQCKEKNEDGTQCEHADRQLSNLRSHLRNMHGISTTVEALHFIYPKPAIPPALLAGIAENKKKAIPTPKKWVARRPRRAVAVDDAPPTYAAVQSPDAHYTVNANPAPTAPQSSSASLAAQSATFAGWVAPTLSPAASTGTAALPAALEYAVQSTTYAGWVSADYSQCQAVQFAAPTQGTAGVFQTQGQEPFVYTQEQAAPVYGWEGYQQAPQYAVAAASAVASCQSNAYATAPAALQYTVHTAPISAEASVAYAQQPQYQYQTTAQLPLNHSPSYANTLPAPADEFLTQWTWTDGYTLDPSCFAPTTSPTTTSSSSSSSFSSPSSYSPSSPSYSPSSSSPSSLSSSSLSSSPPTSPTALADSNPATVKGQEQEYARFSGTTTAPPAFARDFQFTQEGLTQPKALAVAALADFAGSSMPAPAVESQSKSEAQLQLEFDAQAMADFEALFGTEVTPAKIESDYFDFDFDLALSDSDAEALSYWAAWGQC